MINCLCERLLILLEPNRMGMKKIYLTLSFLLYGFLLTALSQTPDRITIKGIVSDSSMHPLDGSTIMLLSSADSSLISFTQSKENGSFELKNISNKEFLLQITHVGLGTYSKQITTQKSELLDLGNIRLLPESDEMTAVIVNGARVPPVTIKNDTIEYNAGSFKTQPNAVVEDLLKKLPGIEVDKNGTIKAQGKEVQRITVEGKEFFGNDPKIATKNLPADAIAKVQVHDRKSDQSQFTGIDDGQREKTINLTLREDKKNILFGNLTAGGGPDNRYTSQLSLNKFSKARQFSVIGMGNNINQEGFSINDYLDFSGTMKNIMSGRGSALLQLNADDLDMPLNFGGKTNGYLTNWAGGANFNNEISKKAELNGSYFYRRSDQDVDNESNQSNSLPQGTLLTRQSTGNNTINESHKLNLTLDQKIDSFNSLKFTNRFNISNSNSDFVKGAKTYSADESGKIEKLQNEGMQKTSFKGDGVKTNSELLFRHRFAKKGRTISGSVNFAYDHNNKSGFSNSINTFYADNSVPLYKDTVIQESRLNGSNNNYGANISYTETVFKRTYLELNYNLQKSERNEERKVYSVNGQTGKKELNNSLSNQFRSDFTYQREGFNMRHVRKNFNGSAGLSIQHSTLNGMLLTQNTSIEKKFVNILPNARLQYDFSNSRNASFTYDANVRAPEINQLSPIADNTDPLNIYVGNPGLRPEYSHNLSVQFSDFNQMTFGSLFGSLNYSYTANKISFSQFVDEQLVRTYKPVNVKNNHTVTGSLTKGFRIRPLGVRLSLTTDYMNTRGLSIINSIENSTRSTESGNTIRAEYVKSKIFDISASAKLSFNKTDYSLNKSMNQRYTNQFYNVDANCRLFNTIYINSSLDYSIYNLPGSVFNQKIPLWNASVSRSFLKKKQLEVKLSATDLLDKNVSVNRIAMSNFVQDERIRSLGRYFLLSFTYSLRNAKGSSPTIFTTIQKF